MSSSPCPGQRVVTARLREALEAADCRLLADLLHPNVHWSPPEGGDTGCHARSHVLSRCSRLHALGLRAYLEETFTYPAAVVLGLRIHGTVPPADPESVRYHVFDVTGGLITRITGYTDRAQALEAAFTGATAGYAMQRGAVVRGPRTGTSGPGDPRLEPDQSGHAELQDHRQCVRGGDAVYPVQQDARIPLVAEADGGAAQQQDAGGGQ